MKYIAIIFLVLLCSCSAKQYQEFWLSEDGKHHFNNGMANTASYETFRPLQQYHGKSISFVKQEGRVISFGVKGMCNLTIRVENGSDDPRINGVPLEGGGFLPGLAAKEKTDVFLNKKGVQSDGFDLAGFNNKTIDWIVVLETGIFIKFTDRSKCHISTANSGLCINNTKYHFTDKYYG